MNSPRPVARPASGIGRAVEDVIDDLLRQLQNPEENRAVHRIRVDIKRLRAWLRLIRSGSDFDWRRHDRRLRDLARQLSAKRDSQVILDSLQWLEKKAEDEARRRAIERLRSHIRFEPERQDVDWPAVKGALADEMGLLRSVIDRLDTNEILRRGLRRTYKRADRRGDRAFSPDGGIEDLHRLRKWVKYLYYQIQLVRSVREDEYGKTHERLNELGDKLGRIHDLAMVRDRVMQLAEMEDCRQDAAVMENLIDRRMERLTVRSKRLYRKVFNVRPAVFVQPLEA